MVNGPVPAYVAPLQPSKTFSEAITQGTQNLGPLMAAAARNNLARETARRKQRDDNLKEIRGYNTGGWSEKHRDIFEEQKILAVNAILDGSPMANTILDNVSVHYDFYNNHATEVAPQREEYVKGILQIGSLDTEDSKFTGDALQLIEHDNEYDAGGIGSHTVNPDGSVTVQYVGASGEDLNESGSILGAPGINRQGYYTRDFGPQDNITPEEFADRYQDTAKFLVNEGEKTPEKIRELIKADMLGEYDNRLAYSASAKNLYRDLVELEDDDFKERYIEAALDLLPMDKPDARGGSRTAKLSTEVLQNSFESTLSVGEALNTVNFDFTVGVDEGGDALTGARFEKTEVVQQRTGRTFVPTLINNKKIAVPNIQYQKEITRSQRARRTASELALISSEFVSDKVLSIEVYPPTTEEANDGLIRFETEQNGDFSLPMEASERNEQEEKMYQRIAELVRSEYFISGAETLTVPMMINYRGANIDNSELNPRSTETRTGELN